MGRTVGEKLTLYFKRVMSFRVSNDVLPGVFVRVCACVCVPARMLIFTGQGWIVAVSFTTQFIHTQKKCSLVKVSMLNFNNVFIPKWGADCRSMTQKNMHTLEE